jgi:hypothetical protein
VFSGSYLSEPAANAAEFVTVPTLYLAYLHRNDPDPCADIQTVALPLYLTSTREKIVVEVRSGGSVRKRVTGAIWNHDFR